MIRDLDSHCIKDGPHAHNGSAMWNPDYAPGPMCEKHKNEYLREHDMERTSLDKEYTQPDERTSSWKEKQAHKQEYSRTRVDLNDR